MPAQTAYGVATELTAAPSFSIETQVAWSANVLLMSFCTSLVLEKRPPPTGTDGAGQVVDVPWQGTFGEVAPGALLVYEDSYGRICLAANQADAAGALGLVEDQALTIRR